MNLLGFLHILEVTSAVLDSCQGIYRQEKIRRRQKSCNMAKNINKDLLSLRTPTRRFAPRWLVPSSSSPLPSTHRIAPGQGYKLICTLGQEHCSWSRVQINLSPWPGALLLAGALFLLSTALHTPHCFPPRVQINLYPWPGALLLVKGTN